MGSQWLRVLLKLLYLLQDHMPHCAHFVHPLHGLSWLWVLAAVPGATTLVAKRLANASAFDKANFPDRANTDEMARQPKGTLECLQTR